MKEYFFSIANQGDDKQLRALIQKTPMEGEISFIFEREPSYFYAAGTEGKFNQTIIARKYGTKDIIGIGSRSIKPAFINGKIVSLGYLSSLRIRQDYRSNIMLSRGYDYLKRLHQDNRTRAYISTIVEDNIQALSSLTAGRGRLPRYHNMGIYYIFAVKLISMKKKQNKEFAIVRGSQDSLDGIIDCIHRNGKGKQFYPYYEKTDFNPGSNYLRDFKVENFYVALKNNQIVGVLAAWDQRSFKQAVIYSYSGRIGAIRPIYNLVSKLSKQPTLPRPGSKLESFYVSFIAVDSNSLDIFSSLIAAAYNDNIGKDYSYMLLGLHEKDPLIGAIKKYKHVKYKSRVFIVCWDDGEGWLHSLDNRVPYLELSTL